MGNVIIKNDFSRYILSVVLLAFALVANADDLNPGKVVPGIPPDFRDRELPAKFQKGDFLAVPIPTSNPTTGTGLIGVAAYFWGQTDEQKQTQPPSVSGLGGMYTDTQSWVVGLGQTAYWNDDLWRFAGAAGVANLNLPLFATDVLGTPVRVDWEIDGELAFAQLSRRLFERVYLGFQARYLAFDQTFSLDITSLEFDLLAGIRAASAGLRVMRDTRDSTTNAHTGSSLTISGLYTRRNETDNASYQSYDIAFRSYHELNDSIVLAWRAELCERTRNSPLWDSCRIGLRGFATTKFMGRSSQIAEFEARWQVSRRWGAVVFGGAGQVQDSLSERQESDVIPSYGVGLRFLVQPEQQVNLRLDYGRSSDSDAIYFSVGEAF